jgi:hypothetical protein
MVGEELVPKSFQDEAKARRIFRRPNGVWNRAWV